MFLDDRTMNRLSVLSKAFRLRGGSAAAPSKFSFVKPHQYAIPSAQMTPQGAATTANFIYNTFFSTNARYVSTVLAVTIVGEIVFVKFWDNVWKSHNGNVRLCNSNYFPEAVFIFFVLLFTFPVNRSCSRT
jgi:hypothetical protein